MEEEKIEIKPRVAEMPVGLEIDDQLLTDTIIKDCCRETMDLLSKNNPMMVCQKCKQMIKVFRSEAPFINFVRFCQSRNRTITANRYGDLWVVTYQAFNSYGR